MYTKIQKGITLIIAIVFFSCTTDKEIEIPEELNNLNRIEHKVSFDVTPLKLIYHKGKLITTNIYSKMDRFTIFSVKPFEYLYSFGSVGRSNSEFLHTFSILSDNYMEVLDLYRIKYIDLKDSIANVSSIKNISIEALNNFGKINDSTYFTSNKRTPNDEHELSIFYTNSNDVKEIGERPKWGATNEIATFDARYNKRLNKFALFYDAYPEFKIMDVDGRNSKTFKIKVDEVTNPIDERSVYFINTYSTDKYIYVYWINKRMNKIDELKDNNLLVFDWEGNIKCNYKLSGIHNFYVVNDDDTKLYTLSVKRDTIINEFDLPN